MKDFKEYRSLTHLQKKAGRHAIITGCGWNKDSDGISRFYLKQYGLRKITPLEVPVIINSFKLVGYDLKSK
jgi:hypothetical protein